MEEVVQVKVRCVWPWVVIPNQSNRWMERNIHCHKNSGIFMPTKLMCDVITFFSR